MLDLEGSDRTDVSYSPAQAVLRVSAVVAMLLAIGVLYDWGAFAFVMALIVCIFLHELGHYLAGKHAGMKVTQFFLFFGPRVWSFRRGETEYGVRLLPLGAFVKVPGMHNLDTEVDPADEARTYRAAPARKRILFASAGSLMHFAIALLLFFVVFVGQGKPVASDAWSIAAVSAGSPAAAAGLAPGDTITAFNGQPVTSYERLTPLIRANAGQRVELTVRHGTDSRLVSTTLVQNPNSCRSGGFLGIGPDFPATTYQRMNPLAAVGNSVTEFVRGSGQAVTGLGTVFSPSGLKKYTGAVTSGCNTDQRMLSPIGAAKLGGTVAREGVWAFLSLLAIVNLFIGIVNWVPLLPFDGGHMAIAAYEGIRSRGRSTPYRADVGRLLPLTYAVVLLLGLLFIGNTYLDLTHGIGG